MPKRTTIALLFAGGIFLWGCSKTQDTAPETRIFGSPATINSVTLNAGGQGQATCDYAPSLAGQLCEFDPVAYGPSMFANFPSVTLTTHYTEASFNVSVSDPESTPTASDILLVSASYKTSTSGTPTEIALVVMDDGSTNKFRYQQTAFTPEDCSRFSCPCQGAFYDLTSNDQVAGDNIFTRGFAVVSGTLLLTAPTGFPVGANSILARDCIAKGNRQFPAFVDLPLGSGIPFKIEVVDKEGNLTTWPAQPAVTFQQTTYTCQSTDNGNCACCVLLSNDPSKCHGLSGLLGTATSSFPNGFCKDVL